MMLRALSVAAASIALALISGCASYAPFTQELRHENSLSNSDLKNLQYYISTRVVLRRELTSNDRAVTGAHKLVIVSGKQVEEVVLESKTPGVAVAVADSRLAVSFEPGASLLFAPTDARIDQPPSFAEAPNPFPGNADEAERAPATSNTIEGPYALVTDHPGFVTYQGKPFEVVEGVAQASLLIDAEALDHVVTTRKVVPGMRLH